MATTINSPEYAFTYVGSPTTDAAKLKTLKNGGPILLAMEGKWANMLPDVIDKVSHAPKALLYYVDFQAMLIPAVIIDADMMDKGVHFAVKLPRLAKYTKDIDDAGFDWSPIPGPPAISMTIAARTTPNRHHGAPSGRAHPQGRRRHLLDRRPR